MTLKIAVFAPIPSARVRTAMKVNPGVFRSWRRAKRRSFMAPSDLSHGYFGRGRFYRDTARARAQHHRFPAAVDFSFHRIAIGPRPRKRQLARYAPGTRFRFYVEPRIGRNHQIDAAGGRFQVHVARDRRFQLRADRSTRGAAEDLAVDVFETEPASAGFYLRVATKIAHHDRAAGSARLE